MTRSTWTYVLVILLALTPGVAGHAGHDGPEPPPKPPPSAPIEADPWFTRWEGANWYGSIVPLVASSTPVRHLRASGDFAVWESAGDIVALHTASGASFNITSDPVLQQNPVIDGRTVVYEQRNGATWDLYAYDLDTGTSRRLTASPGNEKDPYLRGGWLAWLDDRHGTSDVYAMNLANGTEFPVALSKAKKYDVVVLADGVVAWREIEYNQWDIVFRQVPNGSVKYLTRDRTLEHPPQTDGTHLYWVKAGGTGRDTHLYRWSPATGEIVSLGKKGVSTNPITFLENGVQLIYSAGGPGVVHFTAVNRSSDRYTTVGQTFPAGQPTSSGNTVFFAARNETAHVVLAARISPYAVERPPELRITRPLDGGVLFGPTIAAGTYRHAPSWPEPLRFEYRLAQSGSKSEWHPFGSGANWTSVLDVSHLSADRGSRLFVRAVYDGAPPAEQSVGLTLRRASTAQTVDLAGELDLSLGTFVERNPGVVLLVFLAVALLVLLALRWRLRRGRRVPIRIEYVRPEEDA